MSGTSEKSRPPADLQHPTDVPPAYAVPASGVQSQDLKKRHPADEPPIYASGLPPKFPVGPNNTVPLVNLAEVENHLRLLGAFWQLHEDVVGQDWGGGLDAEECWAIFVTRSVCRFENWYLKVVNRDGRKSKELLDDELPPLDVAMIWHAFCLNPGAYYEDGTTRTQNLYSIGAFPLARLSATIDATTMRPQDPSPDLINAYTSRTGDPFSPNLIIRPAELAIILCPRCQHEVRVPWIGKNGTGYGQVNFRATCRTCKLDFGKEAMGVRRFCEHAKGWLANQTQSGIGLSGTLLENVTGLPNTAESFKFNRRLLNYFTIVSKDMEVAEIGDNVQWKVFSIEQACRTGMRMKNSEATQPRFKRVLNHYLHPGVFSLDLVGATLRQGAFVQQMAKLGWTAPDQFQTDKQPLVRSIARYHAWLDLMSSDPLAFYVPTLDIDLIWHTAMLNPERYRSTTQRLLGRTPDHDDKIEEGALSDGFEATSRAWRARFGVPYSYCGCIPPAETSSLNMFNKMKGKNLNPLHKSSTRTRLDATSALDLASPSSNDADPGVPASHASEHNSMLVVNNAAAQKRGAARHSALVKRVEALRKGKGKGDPWLEVHMRRHARAGHQEAFQATKPGDKPWSYLPYIFDGSALEGSRCVAGLPGGLCQAGGSHEFCGTGAQCGAKGPGGAGAQGVYAVMAGGGINPGMSMGGQ